MNKFFKGVLKTALLFIGVLILGAELFRREEVWRIIFNFYTNWSPELLATLLFTGAVTALYAYKQLERNGGDETQNNRKNREERRKAREERRNNSQ